MTKNKLVQATMAVAALNLFMAVPRAGGAIVEYSTTGVFSTSGTNTASLTQVGGSGLQDHVVFTGVSNLSANAGATPVTSSLGNLFVSIIDGSSGTASGDFQLTITQTSPGPASASFSAAVFSGTISRLAGDGTQDAAGQLVLTFMTPTITLDGIQYSIDGLGAGGLGADQLGLDLYHNTISAAISTALPEPAFVGLIAIAMIGFSWAAIRRRRFRI